MVNYRPIKPLRISNRGSRIAAKIIQDIGHLVLGKKQPVDQGDNQ